MSIPLPVRDGVGPSSIWLPAGPWATVLEFLTQRFAAIDSATWTARLTRGDVVDASGLRVTPSSAYRGGVRLYYYRELHAEPRIPFEARVLYRDEHILVADKPHFLPVVPAGRFLQETLLVRLRRELDLDFLAPVHRLDRETAGVVLFSTERATCGAYHALFQRREAEKTYEAWAGCPHRQFPLTYRSRLVAAEPFFRMQEVDGAPNSETRIEVLEVSGDSARYRLTPVTGRKHQLRVHMAALGTPIVNDAVYPHLLAQPLDDFTRPLQLLAASLAFTDPLTGVPRRFESSQMLVPR